MRAGVLEFSSAARIDIRDKILRSPELKAVLCSHLQVELLIDQLEERHRINEETPASLNALSKSGS